MARAKTDVSMAWTSAVGRLEICRTLPVEVCAFNARTLARVACQHLDSRPDGVAFVAPSTKCG